MWWSDKGDDQIRAGATVQLTSGGGRRRFLNAAARRWVWSHVPQNGNQIWPSSSILWCSTKKSSEDDVQASVATSMVSCTLQSMINYIFCPCDPTGGSTDNFQTKTDWNWNTWTMSDPWLIGHVMLALSTACLKAAICIKGEFSRPGNELAIAWQTWQQDRTHLLHAQLSNLG